MKKLHVLLFFTFQFSFFISCFAQNPTYQQKLFYTCKVWGFVKYFHSNVSVCGVNWDSVLIADLPLVKTAVTQNDFNDALDTILKAAGPMALTNAPPCDTVEPELSRNLNFSWLNAPIFRNDVFAQLDTIKNNFRPHAECAVEVNPDESNGGYLKFQSGDSLILNLNDETNYPDEWHRLLELFVHWNIINYFNPYNYIQNQPWDSTLFQHVINIDTANNDASFFWTFLKITANMNDAHVEGWTSDFYCSAPVAGGYSPSLVLKYIPSKYIVVKSAVPGLTNGDEIIAVNGLTTKQWEDSLSPYISYGDSADLHAAVATYMINAPLYSSITITYLDSLNNIHTITANCMSGDPWLYYYPNDTLSRVVQWKYWSSCNVGYINVGNMPDVGSDVSTCYSALEHTNAIIFDIRNYPASNAVFDLCNYLYPPIIGVPDVKWLVPNTDYPGTYFWEYSSCYGSSTPYAGKVIILFNEQTLSEAEFASMILGEIPGSVRIGSQTAGTDGDITYYYLSQDMITGFTSIGVFYPNGDSTERVGIIPDITVYPTQAGIRAGRDELLEKALEVAGCPVGINEVKSESEKVKVYPNPTSGNVTISIDVTSQTPKGALSIEVFNVYGELVYTAVSPQTPKGAMSELDLSEQPDGVYFYRVLQENGELIDSGKLVIQQ